MEEKGAFMVLLLFYYETERALDYCNIFAWDAYLAGHATIIHQKMHLGIINWEGHFQALAAFLCIK